jgi:hypothetical protein
MCDSGACGCFGSPARAGRPDNPPGLPAIAYRVGTHPDTRARMLAALSVDGAGKALARLTTRALDDPAIALLDAAAVVSDVLDFYAERIANEGYLRTATERLSILELAREIGYELGPGVAAGGYLSIGVEDRAVGPQAPVTEPDSAVVRAGVAVQSLPRGGGLPQTFETAEEFVARSTWNDLRPRLTRPQAFSATSDALYLDGTDTGVRAGDVMLVAAGDPTALDARPRRVHLVVVESDRTRVEFVPQPPPPIMITAAVLPIGHVLVGGVAVGTGPWYGQLAAKVWSEETMSTMLAVNGGVYAEWFFAPKAAAPAPDLPAAAPGVYVFEAQAAPFGHNAPVHATLPKPVTDVFTTNWDQNPQPVTKTSKGESLLDSAGKVLSSVVRLDTTYRVAPDSWVVLASGKIEDGAVYRVGEAVDLSVADYAISSRVTQLRLKTPAGTDPSPDTVADFTPRTTTVSLQSRRLELAEVPLPASVPAGTVRTELNRLVLGLTVGRPVAVTGERADLPGLVASEVVELTGISHDGGRTVLDHTPFGNAYALATLRINANVVRLTHGQTIVREVLGGGTGRPHQRFRLRKAPVTHVSAATANGVQSTLEVRVDDILWHEVPALYGRGASEEVYVTRRDDSGAAEVIFGDGVNGARVPAGVENVVAHYRWGIGTPGIVPAGAITLMTERPAGVREVVNPVSTSGAEDPESRDAARRNAPLTVTTLDRVVSLADYEDFARTFAGIGKARATELWQGERRVVHLTIAGPGGEQVPPTAPAHANLVSALQQLRDARGELRVADFRRVLVHLSTDVLVTPGYRPETVTPKARAALARAFAFDLREFGQSLSVAEVITVLMSVDGVTDARVVELHPIEEPSPVLRDPLVGRLARWEGGAGAIAPAELLMLGPVGATVTERAR